MFEAWKRALDATIEVPDCEPAINASSPWRGKRASKGGGGGIEEGSQTKDRVRWHETMPFERVRRIDRVKEEGENAEGVKAGGKGWLCLAVKAPGGCPREGGFPRGIRLEGSRLAYRALASRILISRT